MAVQRRLRFLPAAVILGLVLCASGRLRALEIEEVRWGFDGHVLAGHFVPVSVRVSNLSDEPFDGVLWLERRLAVGNRVGARLNKRIFIAPHGRRWVQFYPYTLSPAETWELSWFGGGEEYGLPRPAFGPPARVILTRRDSLRSPQGGIKTFPENLFPPVSGATGSLEAVVLDHAPRWEPARREAFRDWLYGGGTLHLLQTPGGHYPEFRKPLTELNAPLDEQYLGSGRVLRYSRTRAELDRGVLRTDFGGRSDAEETSPAGNGTPGNFNANFWDSDGQLFRTLKQMTRPEHNWKLIHGMSLVYLALIFPGGYLLGRRRRGSWWVFPAILLAIAVFAAGFHYVGKRGYGETTTVHSVAIARPLTDGQYDVTGWTNVFVTDGGAYTLVHPGRERLYSTAQTAEAVAGIVQNGLAGRFRVDIPPYSSRSVRHRARMKGPRWNVSLETWKAEDRVQECRLAIDSRFPKNVQRMNLLYKDRLYRLRRDEGQLVLAGSSRPLQQVIDLDEYGQSQPFGSPWGMGTSNAGRNRARAEVFGLMFEPLLARHLNCRRQQEVRTFELPANRARLLVYAPMPQEFLLDNDRLGRQGGYVLYAFDLRMKR